MTDPFFSKKRIVVKVGSSLLVDTQKQKIFSEFLYDLVAELAVLRGQEKEIVVVSSGAIALGRTRLVHPEKWQLRHAQAAAAVGQISLASSWAKAWSTHNIDVAQILLTLDDTEERRRYLNARDTITTLLESGIVPVINENDTVATEEIRFGDNDRLAARVSAMIEADLLVLLSDVDGLYDRPPHDDNAKLIPDVFEINARIRSMAGASESSVGSGGMITKLDAADIATASGCAMIIASGKVKNPLAYVRNGGVHTLFHPTTDAHDARRSWINGSLRSKGRVVIDQGAVQALHNGGSLLCVGIIKLQGDFRRGDTLEICDQQGQLLAVV